MNKEEFEKFVRDTISKYTKERMREIHEDWFRRCCEAGGFVNLAVKYTD